MADQLKPCPFCRAALVPNNNQNDLYVRRYGTHYKHPSNDCFLSDAEVTPIELGAWNRRAEQPTAAAVDEAEREATCLLAPADKIQVQQAFAKLRASCTAQPERRK